MSPSVLSVLGLHVTSLPCDSEWPRAMGDGYTVKPNHFSLSNSQLVMGTHPGLRVQPGSSRVFLGTKMEVGAYAVAPPSPQ